MPSPRASQALSRFTVLDLTRVRAGPTAVRQLADWGANVIKIDAPEEEGGEPMGGARRVLPAGEEGRRGGGEFPPRREGPARHRLRVAEEDQQRPGLCQHFRFRP